MINVKPFSLLKQVTTEKPQPLPLAFSGAEVILGTIPHPNELVIPVAPTAKTMFGPRGVCLTSKTGSLWVADTGHHRLLGWRELPSQDGQVPDWVIGQPSFDTEGQNAKKNPNAASLNVPTGIAVCGQGLAVADAWNHRVLIWHQIPEDSNVPADVVLGQANFTDVEPNRGNMDTDSDRLHWPYGVFYHNGKLFVADTGNRRVLIWNQLPQENGQPADLVLGQPNMRSRNENGGGSPTASSFRWCHSLTLWHDNLVIVDAGNNRVMIWQGIPTENNTPSVAILGQRDFQQVDINQGHYYPTAATLNLPYGVTVVKDWLIVADTANSRLLGWQYPPSLTALHGLQATALAGQEDFQSKGENRFYGMARRDSFCWPYSVQGIGENVIVADSGNNRVLLWKWHE